MIDIEALDKFCDENLLHLSPEDELGMLLEEYEDRDIPVEDLPCLHEAAELLSAWQQNNTPPEMRRAEADFFFVKWNFVDAKGQPWRPQRASATRN